MLDNEKYMEQVIVGKTYTKGDYINSRRAVNRGESLQYKMDNSHEGIISVEQFDAVREERKRRSNIEIVDGVKVRKNTHYSSKKVMDSPYLSEDDYEWDDKDKSRQPPLQVVV